MSPDDVERESAVSADSDRTRSAADDAELADELVLRARAGDAAAWTRLYQEHFDRLFRDLGFLVGSPALTEELVQESFAVALSSLDTFRNESSFATWLRGIAHNLVRKHWRTHVRRDRAYARLEEMTPEALGARRDDPEARHLRECQADVLAAALEILPAPQREAFILIDIQGLSAADAGERLSITAGNVRVRAARARAQIRDELARLGWLAPREEAR